jgi:hypothetical protein
MWQRSRRKAGSSNPATAKSGSTADRRDPNNELAIARRAADPHDADERIGWS